ncbi:MAG: flagellar motor protein MotB [Pseudomonadota bacterium]
MAEVKVRPIIVVKRKVQAAGHHGGAWKVAYADFVTAMMAFFMVMWLVTAVSKEQRAALFEYFKNPSMEQGSSVKAAPGQAGPGGASTSVIDLGGGLDAPKTSKQEDQGLGQRTDDVALDEKEKEKKQLESLMEDLREAIDKSQALEPFKDQLLLDITPEGLRIQIVDKQNRPMFDSGKALLKDYTGFILREVARYLNTVPNRISLSGHTDDKPFAGAGGYSNWELSADRANAARRALLDGGLETHKIARVVGLASSVLFDKADPLNPINRRISIIVMTKQAEQAALTTDAPLVRGANDAAEPPTGQVEQTTAPEADAATPVVAPPVVATAVPGAAAPATTAAVSPRESVATAAAAAAKALGELNAKR